MSDTPKSRELGLPWRSKRYGDVGYHAVISSDDMDVSWLQSSVQAAATVQCVNLIGPHLDDRERMAVFEAVAGMDDLDLSRLSDFMKDHGLMEME